MTSCGHGRVSARHAHATNPAIHSFIEMVQFDLLDSRIKSGYDGQGQCEILGEPLA